METEKIALIIAVYGALLSTYIAIRQVIKDRRKLSIILEYIPFYERHNLIITNSGTRPITISKIELDVKLPHGNKEEPFWKRIHAQELYEVGEVNEEKFYPFTLSDGKSEKIPLSRAVSAYLMESDYAAKIMVFDSEGRIHRKYERRELNPRTGRYEATFKRSLVKDWISNVLYRFRKK